MNTKTLSAIAGAILTVAAASPSFAADSAMPEFSANVSYVTDYRFRGISQGDRSQAIQGGFDIELDNGLYAGTWASNVTFSGAAIEVDYYAGFATDLSDDVGMDVGFLWYNYPEDDSDPDLDYYEIYGSVSFYDGAIGLAFSPDYFAETGDFWYVYGDYSLGVADNFSIDLHVGLNLFNSDEEFASFIGPGVGEDPGKDYLDYSVGVSTAFLGLDWGLAWIGTDLKKAECFAGTKLCDDTVVLSVSKSL